MYIRRRLLVLLLWNSSWRMSYRRAAANLVEILNRSSSWAFARTGIIRDMYRAEVELMSPDADLIPRMGLYRVVIYEGERFVRTDKENVIISVAEKHAKELNYQFGHRKKKGVRK
jgi:hypothetical protein